MFPLPVGSFCRPRVPGPCRPHTSHRFRPPVALHALRRRRCPPRTSSRAPPRPGCALMALTDHDTVDGVGEALAAAREHGLRCSPAAELSSVSGEFEDLHVCGYELRHDDPELRATLADFRADRGRRIWAMADRLEELGFALDRAELRGARGRRPAARAPAPRRRGARPPGQRRQAARRGHRRPNALFPPYLVPGAIAYVARSRPTVERGDRRHPRRGRRRRLGAPVLGHRRAGHRARRPATASPTRARRRRGFYATHDEEQTRLLHDAARERGLLTTGSADFHGPRHERFNRFGAFELYGLEPELGPIASLSAGRLAAAGLAGPVRQRRDHVVRSRCVRRTRIQADAHGSAAHANDRSPATPRRRSPTSPRQSAVTRAPRNDHPHPPAVALQARRRRSAPSRSTTRDPGWHRAPRRRASRPVAAATCLRKSRHATSCPARPREAMSRAAPARMTSAPGRSRSRCVRPLPRTTSSPDRASILEPGHGVRRGRHLLRGGGSTTTDS